MPRAELRDFHTSLGRFGIQGKFNHLENHLEPKHVTHVNELVDALIDPANRAHIKDQAKQAILERYAQLPKGREIARNINKHDVFRAAEFEQELLHQFDEIVGRKIEQNLSKADNKESLEDGLDEITELLNNPEGLDEVILQAAILTNSKLANGKLGALPEESVKKFAEDLKAYESQINRLTKQRIASSPGAILDELRRGQDDLSKMQNYSIMNQREQEKMMGILDAKIDPLLAREEKQSYAEAMQNMPKPQGFFAKIFGNMFGWLKHLNPLSWFKGEDSNK